MSCFTRKIPKVFAFFLFAFFLLLFSGCKNSQGIHLPQTDKPAKIPSAVKKIRFDLIVDTPFIFQNKLYLSAVGAPERDSYYNLLLEYDLKKKKQRIVATSSYYPGNIQKIKANNRWLVFCDGQAEVGPEELVVIDLKKDKKKTFYKGNNGNNNQLSLVGSVALYQNYLAFCTNSNLKLIDLKKEKVVFQKKLKLEPGAVNDEVSFDQGKLFWSEREGDKVIFYSYQFDSGEVKEFSLRVGEKKNRYGLTQAKNGLVYFAEFPYSESGLYDLRCYDTGKKEIFTIEKNCFYMFSPFEGGVLYWVKTKKGKALRAYYSQKKKKVDLRIENFSKNLAQLAPLPTVSEHYFLAVEPVKKKEKLQSILYIVDLRRYK